MSAGKFVLDANGNRALDSDGKFRLFDSSDLCDPCCESGCAKTSVSVTFAGIEASGCCNHQTGSVHHDVTNLTGVNGAYVVSLSGSTTNICNYNDFDVGNFSFDLNEHFVPILNEGDPPFPFCSGDLIWAGTLTYKLSVLISICSSDSSIIFIRLQRGALVSCTPSGGFPPCDFISPQINPWFPFDWVGTTASCPTGVSFGTTVNNQVICDNVLDITAINGTAKLS